MRNNRDALAVSKRRQKVLGVGPAAPASTLAAGGHAPVMPSEVVAALVSDRQGVYVDATFGRGGHAKGLLAALSSQARLLALDRDGDAVTEAQRLAHEDARVTVHHGRFGDLARHLRTCRLGPLTGVLFDVGTSSPQLDEAARGFSFSADGPLDMRMDQRDGTTAAAWLNSASESEIATVIRRYGEQHQASRVARRIVAARPLATTAQLADAVGAAMSSGGKPALARVFQAVRIHINDELAELERGLAAAFEALAVGGRLAVVTFHGLEHRLVRRRFREWTQGRPAPPGLPAHEVPAPLASRVAVVAKGVRASASELAANPRARSALLQAVEKVSANRRSTQPSLSEPCWPERQSQWMACAAACHRAAL